MIRPVKTVTVTSNSNESDKNKPINEFIRRFGESSILPRNYQENETLRKILERDGDNGGDLNARN